MSLDSLLSGGGLFQDYVNGSSAIINRASMVVPLSSSSSNVAVHSRNTKCILQNLRLYRSGTLTTREDATGNTVTSGDIDVDIELILDGISFVETLRVSATTNSGLGHSPFYDLFIVSAASYGGKSLFTRMPVEQMASVKIKAVRSIYAGHTLVSGAVKIEFIEVY
ncbi:hypothetical protein [Pseudoalteromonas sp. MMG024]|uniref:hypothetical protein n=1 Tax=Pseudoalteromonas sp. MMG024 TaxID=2909980 RepID=UPI001F409D48|nr:hypothetical protein [Pseudoalteromonas sp. MMG024]MCF6459039.1 hypothetical protein [Pseudoalteromonas sp. MMG024]